MNYLLDTHIWIWSQDEAQRLGKRVQRVLGDARSGLWLSPMSLAECGMLALKRKIDLSEPILTWIPKAASGLHEAVTTNEVALASYRYLDVLKDPADRIIVATAAVYGLCLITADSAMTGLQGVEILNNDD